MKNWKLPKITSQEIHEKSRKPLKTDRNKGGKNLIKQKITHRFPRNVLLIIGLLKIMELDRGKFKKSEKVCTPRILTSIILKLTMNNLIIYGPKITKSHSCRRIIMELIKGKYRNRSSSSFTFKLSIWSMKIRTCLMPVNRTNKSFVSFWSKVRNYKNSLTISAKTSHESWQTSWKETQTPSTSTWITQES